MFKRHKKQVPETETHERVLKNESSWSGKLTSDNRQGQSSVLGDSFGRRRMAFSDVVHCSIALITTGCCCRRCICVCLFITTSTD